MLNKCSNPFRTGPYKSEQFWVNHYPEALKRYNYKSIDSARWGERVRDRKVMDLISVEDVISKIDYIHNKT